MTSTGEHRMRSPIVGHLRLPPSGARPRAATPVDPQQQVPMLLEVNARYPGGLAAVTAGLLGLWSRYAERAGGSWPEAARSGGPALPNVPPGLAVVAPTLFQCVLSRGLLQEMVDDDRRAARDQGRPPVIFRAWPDYPLYPHIDRSAPTVKADAAWRSYDARGRGVVWAVVDSGIDATHPHFADLELYREFHDPSHPGGLTSQLHRDFSYLVNPDSPATPADPAPGPAPATPDWRAALVDEQGHGTHVAGIIAGCSPGPPALARIAESADPGGGYVSRERAGRISGMAPAAELVSLKVMRRNSWGTWVTSFGAVIRALTYLRTEVNVTPDLLRVHGVNLSLGCDWAPDQYAAGQSPLSRVVNELAASGVVVVVSAGNSGANRLSGDAGGQPAPAALMGSISEPAHAQGCIAVGSTHRDAPHVFGVTWTSGKGPTLDGRMKPDVVAPGEWITSAATGEVRGEAGFTGDADPARPDYAELSGTSMAAPHVSGVLASFLSVQREYVGRPREVKDLLAASATDLGRERYAQGAGLVDLMRMLSSA